MRVQTKFFEQIKKKVQDDKNKKNWEFWWFNKIVCISEIWPNRLLNELHNVETCALPIVIFKLLNALPGYQ